MAIAAEPRSPSPDYTRPYLQLLWMVVVLAAVAGIVALLHQPLIQIFEANRWLNGLILGVFAVGVIACFLQTGKLIGAASWAERFAEGREGLAVPPRLLTSMSALLGTSQQRSPLTADAARVVVDTVQGRIVESRDITRYLAGLLIFLGLLGTFWGLARTIPALIDTIRALSPREGEEALDTFGRLAAGFESQLAAMGTAFSSSLMGLAGSLVVGLLDLLSGQAQNRFVREFEEWISTAARTESTPPAPPGEDPMREPPMPVAELSRLVRSNSQQIAVILETLRANATMDRGQIRTRIEALERTLAGMKAARGGDPALIQEIEKDLRGLRTALGGRSRIAGTGTGIASGPAGGAAGGRPGDRRN